MSHHIDYASISWEQFEDLCLSLWFDEGYTNIKPMGRRREAGRDAVFVDNETRELTLFQFKRWNTKYELGQLKSMIRQASEKIKGFGPRKFILNSAHEPNAAVNDWIPSLAEELGFEIEYWDRSWADLRLDNSRQDLRRDYFNLNLAHHTWESLVVTCEKQRVGIITNLSSKYRQEAYVKRNAEDKFFEFSNSTRVGLAIVDRAGRGKTNILCNLSHELRRQGKIVVLVRGDATLTDDHSLERLIVDALGYDSSGYQAHLKNAAQLLKEQNETCFVLLDGLSETNDPAKANRTLRNLLVHFSELGCFKLCFTCRDVAWAQISYDLPNDLLFQFDPKQNKPEMYVGDFSDKVLTAIRVPTCNRHQVADTWKR